MAEALNATSWPELKPSMDDAIGSSSVTDELSACGSFDAPLDVDDCSWGSPTAKHTAVIVGDSISMAYVRPLRGVVSHLGGWRLVSAGTFDCPFTSVEFESSTDSSGDCHRRKQQAVAAIRDMRPDVLFVSNIYALGVPQGGKDAISGAAYASSTTKLLRQLQASVGKIVLLAAPPAEINPEDCYAQGSSPADCVDHITRAWLGRASLDQQIAGGVGGEWVDSRSWFCSLEFELCPPFVGSTPVRVDTVHATLAYQDKIAPVIGESLSAAKIWTGPSPKG